MKSIYKKSMKIRKYVKKAVLYSILKMARADILSGLKTLMNMIFMVLNSKNFSGLRKKKK